ncbi:hypothetical protein GCM10010365_03730 [Streptomyces poonensis]|uniref:Uncharacterized protein n=1 Tax=Streptomyces poonensis TaxID=68255 RepID=A0A918UBU3_9ACTN|nr:hypothetical protein GCM10010365_03730 [Streptomyces poonensis]GLJ92431.1 hypothetical protein GCM10017589_50400 [Streptomyces poonensis]
MYPQGSTTGGAAPRDTTQPSIQARTVPLALAAASFPMSLPRDPTIGNAYLVMPTPVMRLLQLQDSRLIAESERPPGNRRGVPEH